MKIVVKKRQQVGELWQTIFEYKFDEQLIGKEICVDNIAEGPRELKGFLGTSKIINNDTVKFGFKALKKRLFSLELEIFGEGLFKAKNDKPVPCKIKLAKNKEINFYRYDNNNHIVYIITLVNDNVCFKNIKQNNEELMNSKEFQEFAKKMDEKLDKKSFKENSG